MISALIGATLGVWETMGGWLIGLGQGQGLDLTGLGSYSLLVYFNI